MNNANAEMINAVAAGEKKPCQVCGSLNNPDSAFCMICGTRLTAAQAENAPAFEAVEETAEDTVSALEAVEETVTDGTVSAFEAVEETVTDGTVAAFAVVEDDDDDSDSTDTSSQTLSVFDTIEDDTPDDAPVSAFARGLPAWDILPPGVVVRRNG